MNDLHIMPFQRMEHLLAVDDRTPAGWGQCVLERPHFEALHWEDGYQHVPLQRDASLLVVDAAAPFGNEYLVPRGRLREPLSAMTRASAVLVTRASQAERLDGLKATV